jgi:hypothetical protein
MLILIDNLSNMQEASSVYAVEALFTFTSCIRDQNKTNEKSGVKLGLIKLSGIFSQISLF